jgi:beta-1,4-mannooligosaccharide/beta-1,4-mannosyl-N-acetylglucosamine phosphorylase
MPAIFQRHHSNPILTPEDMPFPALAVLNPGAVEQGGQVLLLVRIENCAGHSNIHVARSENGVDDWEIEPEPLLAYGRPDMRYEQWGCEDPRVSYLAEEQCYYITYTTYSPNGAAVGLARSCDLTSAERIGLIFPPNNKDAALFPKKIDGRWVALHRPDAGDGIENIWIAFSKDLVYWGEPHCVLKEGHGAAWDAVTVGTGPPPLETDEGWLLLYHGVKLYGRQPVYRVGTALLDKKNVHKVKARSSQAIFKPTELYETSGLVANVVFPTGLIRRGDELWMYYGAADQCIALATARLDDVLATLES